MPYIERSLGEGETLIRMGQFHWFHRARAWTVFSLALGLAFAPLIAYGAWWAFLTIGAIGILFFIRLMLPIWTTEIGVTNQRLILKRGLLARHTDEMELRAIEGVNLQQGVWGRIFGYGRIEVQGTGDDSVSIPPIGAPLAFRKALQESMSHAHPSGTADAREGAHAAAQRASY